MSLPRSRWVILDVTNSKWVNQLINACWRSTYIVTDNVSPFYPLRTECIWLQSPSLRSSTVSELFPAFIVGIGLIEYALSHGQPSRERTFITCIYWGVCTRQFCNSITPYYSHPKVSVNIAQVVHKWSSWGSNWFFWYPLRCHQFRVRHYI